MTPYYVCIHSEKCCHVIQGHVRRKNTDTDCLHKNETGTNIPISLKLNKHLNYFRYWLCTKMLRLRLVPSLWDLRTFFQIVDFYWNRTTTKSVSKLVSNLLQATCSIQFRHSENSLLFCELHHEVCWQFKSASRESRYMRNLRIWYKVKLSTAC